jgi:hypothetical protein
MLTQIRLSHHLPENRVFETLRNSRRLPRDVFTSGLSTMYINVRDGQNTPMEHEAPRD